MPSSDEYSVRLRLDTICQAGPWPRRSALKAHITEVLVCAARHAGLDAAWPFELCVVLTDDAHMRRLNAHWRGRNAATNVLSFPAACDKIAENTKPALLGDIIVAYETIEREADRDRIPFINHLTHLIVHGFLHLVGYHHNTDDNARTMQDLETRILRELMIPDPYDEPSTRA